MFQTEHEFMLPIGYLDDDGDLHRSGTMRLATAADEILPLKDHRVQANQAYLIVVLLSRVIKLDDIDQVTPKTIERMFSADLSYLQEFYNQINRIGKPAMQVTCPKCDAQIQVGLNENGNGSGVGGF